MRGELIHIFTIGYEGATLCDFLATLQLAGVQSVLDVREVAQSRRRGFSKTALAEALKEVGSSLPRDFDLSRSAGV